jgi:serine/threonine-protein kinase
MSYVHQNLPVTDFPPEPANIGKYLVPPPTTVPNVVGLPEDAAVAKLREAKLNASVEPIPSLEPAGIVVRQSVAGGATVRQGSFVTIYISTGELPIGPLPNLTGLTMDEASEIVSAFELDTGVKVNLSQQEIATTNQSLVGRIVQTNPPPASEVQGVVDVVVFIGVLQGPQSPPTTTTTTPPSP